MSLGENITKLRTLKNITTTRLAQMSGVGQPYISSIENGKKVPSLEVLQQIAKALNTTSSDLLGEVPMKLDGSLMHLVDVSRKLSDPQIEALIRVVEAFKGYEQGEEEPPRVAEK